MRKAWHLFRLLLAHLAFGSLAIEVYQLLGVGYAEKGLSEWVCHAAGVLVGVWVYAATINESKREGWL